MKKQFLLLLPFILLAGCLPDNIDGPQVVSRPIFPPAQVYFRAVNVSDLQIRWNPSPSDTQQNFKGYLVRLFRSAPFAKVADDLIDSVFDPIKDSAFVLKTDTSFIFKNISLDRYTVQVFGQHSSKADTEILSKYPQSLSFDFDPRPVSSPIQLSASSAGPTSINLFWQKSASESQVGMAGYVIRYKDTTNANSKLLTLARFPIQLNIPYYNKQVTVPPDPNNISIPEHPYKFWIKAIRKDSVESDDSVSISWSGALRIPGVPLAVRLDTGIFMGVVGFTYNLVQTLPTDPSPQLLVSQSGTDVVVRALNGTKFFINVKTDTNLTLDNNYFSAPFLNSDFTETQLTFPASGSDRGAIIYALLPDKNRARVLFQKQVDSTGGSNNYIRPNNTILIQASFQPIEPNQLPFF